MPSPYVTKDYDAEFASVRNSAPAYDPSRFYFGGFPVENLFSRQFYGDSANGIAPTIPTGAGLPAWFYGGALVIVGAVLYFRGRK